MIEGVPDLSAALPVIAGILLGRAGCGALRPGKPRDTLERFDSKNGG
jgi:hypothetical protein